jgi:hypothetical protein
MLLRCTAKALKLLGERPLLAPALPGDDDWYLNLLWIEGRKSLLLVQAGTLFPVFMWDVRVRDVRPIEPYLVPRIEAALLAEGLARHHFGDLDAQPVRIAKTADRRVLGVMNDMSRAAQHEPIRGTSWTDERVAALNHDLRHGLHSRDGSHVSPISLVRAWNAEA